MRRLRAVLLASTAILTGSPLHAADWIGSTSGNWFTPQNWSTNAVPTSSTAVNINVGVSANPANIASPGAAAGALRVGYGSGGSGTLNISAGGVLNSAQSDIAYDPNTTGTATVNGAGSVWNATQLNLGMDAGATGELNILNGGKVVTGSMYLTYGNGGTGASGTMLVSGNGSSFTSGGFVYAGYGGTGTITVTGNGASFSSGIFNIGHLNLAGVVGSGTFNLQNGATATSGGVQIGAGVGTSGTANISGTDTVWNTAGMTVGGSGAGALKITAGATVYSSGAGIGDQAVVSGANSQWILTGDTATGVYSSSALGLGRAGGGPSSLLIDDGGKVSIRNTGTVTTGKEGDVRIGRFTSTSTVTVTGAGSALATPYDLFVGYDSGSTGILNVSNGGTLNSGHGVIANANGSTGTVTVSGANSVWNISDSQKDTAGQGLFLGLSGGNATLNIRDGAIVNVNSTASAISAGVNSTINIGADAVSPAAAAGTLNANSVSLQGGATTLNFNHTSTNYVFNPSIISSGTVNFRAGTTILTGNNSYTGTTNIFSGATAQFGNGGTSGLISGNVTNNGAMIVKLSSLVETYNGVISGNGTFEQAGSGTLELVKDNTYTGLTKISNGTLRIGNGGATGSVAGDIQNNSHLSFDRSDNFAFNNVISGSGDLFKEGTGTLTLTAANTYTGRTYIDTGTLKLGGSNRLSSTGDLFVAARGTFDLDGYTQTVGAFGGGAYIGGVSTVALGSGSLTFGNSFDRDFMGQLTGSGSIIKQGTGTQTMSGDSSAYTGTTAVNGGSMIVTGDMSNSAITVNSGGTLGGTGTVGAVTVNGIIAPGLANAIGTLNVNGTYTQAANSFYDVNLNAAGASDLVNVTGAANINGGTVRVTAAMGGYNPTTVYTIMTSSGALTGAFAGTTSNFAFLDPSLTYDTHNAYLTLVRNSVDFSAIGRTPNQISAGNGLAALGMANPVVAAALMLTADEARAAFDSVSGEIHPSLNTLMLNESYLVRDILLGRQRQDILTSGAGLQASTFAEEDGSLASSYAKKPGRQKTPKWPLRAASQSIAPVYTTWVQGYGNWTQLNSDGNAATLRSANGGMLGGVDVTLNHNVWFGVAAGGGSADVRVKDRASSGTMDSFHLAVYGGGSVGDIALRTGAAYSHHDVRTTRAIGFPGFSDTAKASYGTSTAQIFGEAAYRVFRGRIDAETFANLAYVNQRSDGFAESGGPAALTVAEANTSATFTTIGLRAQAAVPFFGPWATTAKMSLGWQHALDWAVPVSLMSFAASAAPFAIAGVPIATDAAAIEAGIETLLRQNMTVALAYSSRLAEKASSHTVKAKLGVQF